MHTDPGNESEFPLSTARRTFVGPGPLSAQDLVPTLGAALAGHNDMVVWSFKPLASDVANGAWKPFVTKLAQYIRDNKLQSRVVIVIWHEPENDFKTPALFVSLFDQVHDWLTAVDPTIRTCHAALGYYYRNVTPATAAQWVTKATVNAVDIYSGNSFPLGMTLGDSTAFQTWYGSRPHGRPWAVAERGWVADPAHSADRVASINAEAAWLSSLPAAGRPMFYIVWDTIGTEKNSGLQLDSAAVDAVNVLFARLARPVCPLCHGSGSVDAGTYTVVTVRA